MAKKNKRDKGLTCTFFIGDEQVDKLPDDYLDRMCERLSEAMSIYFTAHPEQYHLI